MFRIALGQSHQYADAAHLLSLLRGHEAQPKHGCRRNCIHDRHNKFAPLHQ
jgi:hypothetical protein